MSCFGTFTATHLRDQVHLGLNLPLRLAPDAAAFGVLAFGIDPETYLYPLLETWPVASASGETVLVRRDGDEAVFLSRLRGRQNSAVNFRIPMSRTDVAGGAGRGRQGRQHPSAGRQGVPLFAAVRRVPDTPWYLIAKMNEDEVQAPVRRRSLLLGLGAVSLILAVGAFIVLWWRRQQLAVLPGALRGGNRAPGARRAGCAGAAGKRIPFSHDLRAGGHRHGSIHPWTDGSSG